jgi:hypothetical protein
MAGALPAAESREDAGVANNDDHGHESKSSGNTTAFAAATASHALWGAYPAAARLATNWPTSSSASSSVPVPTTQTLSATALTVLSVLPVAALPFLSLSSSSSGGSSGSSASTAAAAFRVGSFALPSHVARDWQYWACAASAFARSLLNIVASMLARAATCQMLMLFTPFCVVALDRLLPMARRWLSLAGV